MTSKTVTSLAFAAGCVLALGAMPSAQAQYYPGPQQPMITTLETNGPQASRGDFGDWSAMRNNRESARYDRLLQTNPGFRQARMRKECGPITDPQLRQDCIASFAQYEPSTGSRGRTMARGTTATGDFYTGSSTNPGMTDYDQSTPQGSNWGGLGMTPNNPGPRPSGSGGGAISNGAGR